MAMTAGPPDTRAEARRAAVSLAMAVFATIELVYEWSSVFHRAAVVIDRWCDAIEARDDRPAAQSAVRWVKARQRRAPAQL